MRLSQMSETSVSRLALPGCVEVGESGKSYLEASLQLGVWCFAGLAKLDELRKQSRVVDPETLTPAIDERVSATGSDSSTMEAGNSTSKVQTAVCSRVGSLPVFGWTAIGMDWKLHIAYRDRADGGVTILGPLDSGGLGSALAIFKLFEIATMLARWAKDHYWIEFKNIVR